MEELNNQLLESILEETKRTQVLIRTNNLLLSRFILQLARVRKDLGLPKRVSLFKFELLEEDYAQLIKEFGKEETDKALYRLDRLLLTNKQDCPNNIAKYIRKKLEHRAKGKQSQSEISD